MHDSFEILALTDVSAFYTRPDGTGQTEAHKTLAAFKRIDTGKVQEGLFELTARLPEDRVHLYAHALPADAIVRVRVTREQNRLVMLTLPEPADDDALGALLARETAPPALDGGVFGPLIYDRVLCLYRVQIDWLGQPAMLELDGTEAECPALLETAQTLYAAAPRWEGAAQDALRRVNGPAGCVLDSLSVEPDGTFSFWYLLDDAAAPRAFCVSGSLADGVTGVSEAE